jgi:protein-S-isoprenylcysteine O-methyltransferase Ste14
MLPRLLLHATFAAILFVLPLAGNPSLLLTPAPWLATAVAIALLISQPRLDVGECTRRDAADRGSAIAILASMITAHVAAMVEYSRRTSPPELQVTLLALALVVSGVWLRLWAIQTLGRFFTSTVGVQTGQVVVTVGPYRWLCHPSYTGALLAAVGNAVAFGSSTGVAMVLALCLPAYSYRIAVEERVLVAGLGESYRCYRDATWRLVPGLY